MLGVLRLLRGEAPGNCAARAVVVAAVEGVVVVCIAAIHHDHSHWFLGFMNLGPHVVYLGPHVVYNRKKVSAVLYFTAK